MKLSEIKIPYQLFTSFNDLKYFDEPHKYYVDGNELISVTTLIHKYQDDFDEDYWAQYKANEFGLTKQEILRAWKFINNKGTMKGSIIHDYAENLFLNKIFKYPEEEIINYFGFDPIREEYEITKNHVDRFHRDSVGKLIPIKTELVMYDKLAMIAGMADMLFYNVKAKEFQIWDHKTNKSFSMESERYLKNSLYFLQDCDFNVYSLQLELYKQIIYRNTGIKLGKSYVVWYSHNNPTYKIIEMKDMSYYVDIIINERISQL
jgi:hypothetical protein